MSQYDFLKDFLEQSGKDHLSMSFAQIAAIVGGLPLAAFDDDRWWANDDTNRARHGQPKSWQAAGYRASADRRERIVQFDRI
ncbi:hypothetical protein [Novosphingobium sp. KN65.2]|uniref:DUF7662 domain-containing protein n=1 Tax=Novosphingobium sp. KN65.2 TaxID=1478134 RepID=UPI0005E8F6DF|nr:hypothetical protein [Novosphingobium sp. KN65.2]CDO34764.1 conserved hypothetical protein [Novosphingobium sp. KN65.2]